MSKENWSCPEVIEPELRTLTIYLNSIYDQLYFPLLMRFFGAIFCFQSQFLILESH
jgi:hypothetical protein